MASSKAVFYVGEYTINARDVIGQGSYGIIYTAIDTKGNKIAVKRIDVGDPRKAERITKDLDKLLQLDHPNILKVFDIVFEETVVWIMMEYCAHGDLNKFFRKNDIESEQRLEIMIQIVQGLEYLHRNNIIHRDLKPANILVQEVMPLTVKLTDFDFSKFLTDEYYTSEMSSNVGTAVFKAPEFFMQSEQRKISYHRNVDIFALGLTYLAMIQRNKNLIPRLETAKDDSESHNPIGSTIATRVKHGVKPLNVVAFKKGPSLTQKLGRLLTKPKRSDSTSKVVAATSQSGVSIIKELEDIPQLKVLINRMTSVKPEDRPVVKEILDELELILKEYIQASLKETEALYEDPATLLKNLSAEETQSNGTEVKVQFLNHKSWYTVISLSSLLRKTYGDLQPKTQTEANCEILVKCDFGWDVVC